MKVCNSFWIRVTVATALFAGLAMMALAAPAAAEVDTPLVGTYCFTGHGPGGAWPAAYLSHVLQNNPENPVNPGGVDDDLLWVNSCSWYYYA